MLEYYGIAGAKTTDTISDALDKASQMPADKQTAIRITRRLRILRALDTYGVLVLSKLYLAAKTSYAEAKIIVAELEEEGLLTSKPYLKPGSTRITVRCTITEKGKEHVLEHKDSK